MAGQKNKTDELIEAVDQSRRDLIKKILLGGTAAYVAPLIASFHLNPSAVMANDGLASGSNMGNPLSSNMSQALGSNMGQPLGSNMGQPLGSNMRMARHPLGSNQRRRA